MLLKEEVGLVPVGGRVRGVVQRIVGGCEASPRQAVSGAVRVDGANALTELHRLWGVAYTYMYTLILPYRYSPIPSLPHTLPYFHSPILPFSHTVILPYCHSSILSFSHTVIPPYFHSSILSFLHTVILPYCHTCTLLSIPFRMRSLFKFCRSFQ